MSSTGSLFKRGATPLIGLDISSSSVKLLEFSGKANQVSVDAFSVEPLPPEAVVEKQVAEPEIVSEAISKAVQRAGTKTKKAAIAVSGSSVITKVIEMPAGLKDIELEQQIEIEADQYIPYPVEEVNLDFVVLGENENNPDQVNVLLAACRSDTIDQRIEAVESAGLEPWVVDIEAYALENACRFLRHQMPDEGKGKLVAVVDIGASTTSMIILKDNKAIYTRDQQFGGKQLTEDIMRNYGMTFEEAGKAKKFGNLPENYQSEVLSYFIDDMAQQIDRSLQFFHSSATSHDQIDQIILAGGCAAIDGVNNVVAEKLAIPTVIAEPFSKLKITSKAKPAQIKKDEVSLMIAAGLALRGVEVS